MAARLNKTNGRAIVRGVSTASVTSKGTATRELIVARAYAIACRDGLEGLSIGDLAQAVGMSKSGVFAHFGSREDLQLAVLDHGGQRFADRVFVPALRAPRGLARLRAIVAGWFDWVRENRHGCLIMAAASEYDARPGAQRDRVVGLLERWRSETTRAIAMAIDSGELRAGTDAGQLAFGIFGIALALHQDTRLFDPARARVHAERAVDRLLAADMS